MTLPAILKPSYWRRHKLRALGLLLGFVLAVRLAWGWYVGRQLAAQLAEMRRLDEPVEVSDVVCPSVPDSQNAFAVQLQAAKALAPKVDSPSNSRLDYRDYPPYPPAWWKLADASETAHAKAFQLARQARQFSQVQVLPRLTSPVYKVSVPGWTVTRQLACTVADGAVRSHLTGDDPEAIERILDTLHIAKSLRHDEHYVSQLLAIRIDSLACLLTQIIGPGLQFDATATTRPATRQKVHEVIKVLLDEELAVRGFPCGLMIMHLEELDFCRLVSDGTWFIQPLTEQQMVVSNRRFRWMIEAARYADLPAALRILDRCEPTRERQVELTGWPAWVTGQHRFVRYSRGFSVWELAFSNVYVKGIYFDQYYRTLAERRATAASLACQLYGADHHRWPERIEELVPEYLPAVPANPMAARGSVLGYIVFKGKLPDGSDRPMIYFDAGRVDAYPVTEDPQYSWTHDPRPGTRDRSYIRQYRDVSRFVPAPNKGETTSPGRS
jgi:hypothetical protein